MGYLKDILNESEFYICIIPETPTIAYGPFQGLEAMTFIERENATFTRLNITSRFISVPLSSK